MGGSGNLISILVSLAGMEELD